jgi:A/G-specific adenine glycosylase
VIAVVEVLLKQTRATSVAGLARDFVDRYPSPTELSRASLPELESALSPFGFQRQRALHLNQLASRIVAEPRVLQGTTADLRQLPGLGTYSATAVSVFAHGRREAVIDVNTVRIFSRVYGLARARGELRKSAEIAALALAYGGTTKPRESNWALLDLGAMLCTESRPLCRACPLRRQCVYFAAA